MQDKFIAWVVTQIMKQLDFAVACRALVGLLRGAVAALRGLAAKTKTPGEVDDAIVEAFAKIVDQIALALKVS